MIELKKLKLLKLRGVERNKRAKALLGNTNGIGRVPWNKGLKTPLEVRIKQSKAKKGKASSRKGKKYPNSWKNEISILKRKELSCLRKRDKKGRWI